MILASLLGDLVQPLALLWFLNLGATFAAFRRKQWRSGFLLLSLAGLLYFIGATPVPAQLASRLEAPYVLKDWDAVPNADVIIILGAAITRSDDDLMGFNLKREADRVVTGFELARRQKAKALLLGGGWIQKGENPRTEAAQMQRWYESWGISPLPVHALEGNSNTYDEAVHARALMEEKGWNTALLVTSGTHMPRAEATFRTAGVEVTPVACDFEGTSYLQRGGGWSTVPRLTNVYLMKVYLHEVFGWPFYRLNGRIKDPRPLIW